MYNSGALCLWHDVTQSSCQAVVPLIHFHLADGIQMQANSYQQTQVQFEMLSLQITTLLAKDCLCASTVTDQDFEKFCDPMYAWH
jgi:hypothetical protein